MPFNGDPLAFWGKLIIEDYNASILKQLPMIKPELGVSDPLELSDEDHRFLPQLKVGILGAGVGGLYTALMLDSLDIEYEILEATGRAGGRLLTYHFPGGGKYDYYEEGAMRFPLPKKDGEGKYKNGTMKRLAELIEYGPLNTGLHPLKNTLIPYYFSARDPDHPGCYYFNSISQPIGGTKGDFDATKMGVAAAYIKAGSDAIHKDVVNPFVRILINDMETGKKDGWAVMMENDAYSVHGYMASKYLPSDSLGLPPKHLSNDIINWINLLQTSSGGYDNALTESVFSAFAFATVGENNYGDVDWKCFEGGTETLSKKMEGYINSKGVSVNIHQRVTAISQGSMTVAIPDNYNYPPSVKLSSPESKDDVVEISLSGPTSKRVKVPCVKVSVHRSKPKHYAHVISTLPLPVLRTIDLTDAGLNVMQKNSLRALAYGPSVKIAILFKSTWWTEKLGIVGGQSFTDLPIRTIVYPSYGVDSNTPSKVLIASYTWTTDASRLGALSLKENKEVLKDLVLRNLAEVHMHRNSEITYDFLCREYRAMHVKDWNVDEFAMGAFADFSPGEFENLYAALSVPAADSRLHFAGEAISTRHGWVVGALDSAWKAVYEYLKVTGQREKLEQFKKIWGGNAEWTIDSTLVDGVAEHDLLDEHIALVRKGILAGVL